MKKNLLITTLLGFSLFGCGDETTTVNETTGISQLAKGDALPECSEEISGETLYAADSGKAYICTGKAWTPLHGESSTDTVVISKVDTVIFKDTVILRDTLVGLNGESCEAIALEDGSGYKIVCGLPTDDRQEWDSIGVVLNGSDGMDGVDCTVSDDGNGTVSFDCSGKTTLVYKATCGNSPYEPEKSFCYGDFIFELCNGKSYDVISEYCLEGDTLLAQVPTTYLNQKMLADGEYGILLDVRDSQVYRTVGINGQTWMAQNLNYRYTQGTADLDSSSFCYDNKADKCEKYGRLYTWSAAMDSLAEFSDNGKDCGYNVECLATHPVRGICPEGWHLPTFEEWNTLFSSVGGQDVAGTKLKTTNGWKDDGNGADNYGFSALPAGGLDSYAFSNAGVYAIFWSATQDLWTASIRYTSLSSSGDNANLSSAFDYKANSVRCLKDSD